MIDTKSLECLEKIVEKGSFSEAAEMLCVTQSAVSQRIKALELDLGQPVLVRTHPIQATHLGEHLIQHKKQISLLEKAIMCQEEQAFSISLAASRDCIDTWLVDWLASHPAPNARIALMAQDQDFTLQHFKTGQVSMAISTEGAALPGCECKYMGAYQYLLVASPDFIQQHFDSTRPALDHLLKAPTLIFDQKDSLYSQYLSRFFHTSSKPQHSHMIPSVKGFKKLCLAGMGLALIPRIDIEDALAAGTLQTLWPEYTWDMPLYLHYWSFEHPTYQSFHQVLLEYAKAHFA